ncbi:hypothetical protein [Chlorogloeopsis sp. ULAP02]|uniref:hypothetical protein n=1 Tax=Chlorogloeopsis sp. ULAP02 TaxID=3107926 RepID=UPI003134EC68
MGKEEDTGNCELGSLPLSPCPHFSGRHRVWLSLRLPFPTLVFMPSPSRHQR